MMTPSAPILFPPGLTGLRRRTRAIFDYREDPFAFFESIYREFGGIALNRILGFRFYIVCEPELIEHVLVRNAKNYIKDPFLRSWKRVFGNGLLTSEGEEWKRERRLVQPAFHRDRMDGYGRLMVRTAAEQMESWIGRSELAINREMMQLTLDIVVQSLFGSSIPPEERREVGAAFDECSRYFEFSGSPLGYFLAKLPVPATLRYKSAVGRLDAIVARVLKRKRENPADTGDLLSMLLAAHDEDGSGLSDRQLRDDLMTLFLAGHETTALALTYTIYLICRHPEVAESLRREIDRELGGRDPEPADLPRLALLKQVVQESMRLYPPAWVLGREAIQDDLLGGFTVSAGSVVSVPVWAIHRSERFYERPLEFRPERWTPEFQQRLPRAAYLPFGFGPRMCVGASFAMMEILLILATLLRRFVPELASDAELRLQGSITARPREDVRVRFTPRAGAGK